MSLSVLAVSFLGLLCLCRLGESLDESLIPSGAFRDDLLFDLSWPGPKEAKPSKDIPVPQLSEEEEVGSDAGLEGKVELSPGERVTEETGLVEMKPNVLFAEDDYNDMSYIDMRTDDKEEYRCIIPEIRSWEDDMGDAADEDEMNQAQVLLKSLDGRCTKLLSGYWTYELCHGEHLRQYHEASKQAVGDKEDEYYLGKVLKSSNAESNSEPESTATKDIPVWYFNGHEYPYHVEELGEGTPCDLKDGEPRSVLVRYICDMNSHKTGTLLQIEEVTICKYEAVVATSNLCQSRLYRLKENPVRSINCYSKNGSPSKPISLLEHELTILKNAEGDKNQKPSSKPPTSDMGGKGKGGVDDSLDNPLYPSDSAVLRDAVAPLDEGFVKSFLSGELCLRGGSGWWQHEICYGKHVKQVHEEAVGKGGKESKELFLGYWVEEGHKRWFPNAGSRKQGNNYVTHLYMNGDICDITGVARQCKVKFRCSSSSRPTQISLFLEEPTTCNYLLTVEASFLCPLLHKTDEFGLLTYQGASQEGVGLGKGKMAESDEVEYDSEGKVKEKTPVLEKLDPESSHGGSEKKKKPVDQR